MRGRNERRGGPPPQQAPLELRIESLAKGGEGVAHAPDGRVVFVAFTAPGDLVRVAVVARHERWLRGEVMELLEAGSGRTDPLCPVFGACGGCDWQHLDYATQLEAKKRILADAIERIARLPLPERFSFRASPSPYGYRSRARVAARRGRVGFRRRHSHAVCATSRCPVLVPALDAPLAELAARPPEPTGEWELSAGSDGRASRARVPVLDSGAFVEIEVAGEWLRVSGGSFLQANALLREPLALAVLDAAGSGGRCLELFAGAGLFTLPLARRFTRVLAVESHPGSVADLEENLHTAGLADVEIAARSVEGAFADDALASFRPEVVVLDPPAPASSPKRATASRASARSASSTSPATRRPSPAISPSSRTATTRSRRSRASTSSRRRRTWKRWR